MNWWSNKQHQTSTFVWRWVELTRSESWHDYPVGEFFTVILDKNTIEYTPFSASMENDSWLWGENPSDRLDLFKKSSLMQQINCFACKSRPWMHFGNALTYLGIALDQREQGWEKYIGWLSCAILKSPGRCRRGNNHMFGAEVKVKTMNQKTRDC